MDALYVWIQAHQLIVGLATPVLLGVIGLVAAPAKIAKMAFDVAQWTRQLFGVAAENELKKIVDAFDQGLHGDETEVKK